MAKQRKYAMSFSLNVLNHLGIGLYSNIPAVLSELVANAWDSGATQIRINIGQSEVVIEDNGRGMSLAEINNRFLRIGYQKRKEENTLQVDGIDRHVMGRKGIGKLSAFSIANSVEVQTCKNKKKSGFHMSLRDIETEIDKGSLRYFPKSIDAVTVTVGTKIILRDIRQGLIGLESEIRADLARRFSVIASDRKFEVFVNDEAISVKDRDYYEKIQFIWYLGDESRNFVALCKNAKHSAKIKNVIDGAKDYKLRGWVATVFKPKDIEDAHHAISIFAHGKLIQENILSDIQDARLYAQYLIGEIDADFMDSDEEPDIVTSDRQRINQSDPRYLLLKQFITKEILKKIVDSWDDLREQHRTKPKRGSSQPPDNKDQDTLLEPVPVQESNLNGGQLIEPILLPGQVTHGGQAEILAGSGEVEVLPRDGENGGSRQRQISPPPTKEAESIFSQIKNAMDLSSLEQEFKSVALSDLNQARLAYYSQAYKACVVMLGAVLEGLMLAVLRQTNALGKIRNDSSLPSQVSRNLGGVQKPEYTDLAVFADAVGEKLSFEDYKLLIHKYIPNTDQLGIENIQKFRNAIHPWIAVKKPSVFGTYNNARAMMYLSSLKILTDEILSWKP